MNDNSLMKNLKRIRIEQDMSIETLSQQTGLTTDFLTKLESTPSQQTTRPRETNRKTNAQHRSDTQNHHR